MSGHTPGPWEVEPHSDTDEHLEIVSEYETIDTPTGIIKRAHWIAELHAATDPDLSDSENDEAMETVRANARLMAAAPELLASLKEIMDTSVEPTQAMMQRAEIAIAKAEGR